MPPIDQPRQAPLAITRDETGIVLHDAHSGSTHRLAGAARDIWELSDGTRSPARIAIAITVRYGITPDRARRDVDATLAQFRHAGLIQTPAPSPREGQVLAWAVASAFGTTSTPPPGGFSSIEWDPLVRLAIDHGVMPLLHRCLTTQWQDDVPPIVRERLEGMYATNASVVDGLLVELFDLLRELEEQRVSAVTLKGPVLASLLYGAPEMRQAGDLDVVVTPAGAARARDVLLRRGYTFSAGRRTDALALKASAAGTMAVDLQWALARPVFRFPITLGELMERMTAVEVRGVPVRQPRPAEYLRYLCAHASKHCWSSLIWMADLVAFLRVWGAEVEWNQLLDRAAAAGGEKQILLGFRLAGDVLRADLPSPVADRLRRYPDLSVLADDVRRALFAPAEQRTYQGSLGVFRGGVVYMRTRERLRDRLPYLLPFVRQCGAALVDLGRPTQRDRAVVALPPSLGFLYVGIRPVRVMFDGVKRWLQPPQGDR
jgi:hypothetical protein